MAPQTPKWDIILAKYLGRFSKSHTPPYVSVILGVCVQHMWHVQVKGQDILSIIVT